ncbi:MAG TPA: hypothetical protein VM328_05685 [Fimbriimonadaceae bacterium]|nr:hypothetical protein [Fimbriimonadaceae bacterium]
MRRLAILSLLAPAIVSAQAPDVMLKLDLRPTLRTELGGGNALRWYDALGNHSTVGLYLRLEPGLRALVSERLQRIPNDGDRNQIDEYYIEDVGIWRVGKQYLPFGRGLLIRESVEAARADTNLLLPGIRLTGAIFDAGMHRQRGVVVRLEGPIGMSFAVGRNLAISGTSLTVIRNPEASPGARGGYTSMLGLDYGRRAGMWRYQAEWVALRGGERPEDVEKEVSDVMILVEPNPLRYYGIGWSRAWNERNDQYRVFAQIPLDRSVWAEPMVRYRGGVLKDFSFTVHVKL